MEITRLLLAALLSLYPPPAAIRARLEARREAIVLSASASAERFGVPVAILLVTSFLETHLGTDPNEGGGWGSPIDRRHRGVAGTSDSAARDLAHSFAICGSWRAALHRYRVGLCNGHEHIGYTAETALHIVERTSARAGVPLPDRFQ